MADKQPRSFLEASWQAARERAGTAHLVQCEGCPAGHLTARPSGLCEWHDRSPHQEAPEQVYDVIGNL